MSFQAFLAEIREEAGDFFEDIGELLFRIRRRHPRREKEIEVGGIVTRVRPAYLFAERIDNFLKVIFALSINISALSTTFVGFIKLSDLLEVLMFTWWGRALMLIIGFCYLLAALWKLFEIKVPIHEKRQS